MSEGTVSLASPITSLICFYRFNGINTEVFSWDSLGVAGALLAIISAILATKLNKYAMIFLSGSKRSYSKDSDVELNYSVSTIIPSAAVILLFAF